MNAAVGMDEFYRRVLIGEPRTHTWLQLDMHWAEVWYGPGAGPKLCRTALTPISWLYALGWTTYAGLYDLGIKKPQAPHKPIVCIGNLVVGGSGKTPLTAFLAKALRNHGLEVVVGCSGYGSPAARGASLAPTGLMSAAQWGDEPALLRWLVPEVPIVVGRDRVAAARICRTKYPSSVLLMDDGLQHLPLRKDVAILLDPPSSNKRCLPAGPYREPLGRRSRATIVLPGRFEVINEPPSFASPGGEGRKRPDQASLLCAIGSPASFINSMIDTGVRVDPVRVLPDHDPLAQSGLFDGLPIDRALIVTAKDWVKLRNRTDLAGRDILIAMHSVKVEPAAEFEAWLLERLDEANKPRD